MILSDIVIKWKFDYEMEPEEQTWHEQFVDTFKFKFDRWLQYCGVNSNYQVNFDLIYFPLARKFIITKISLNMDLLIYHLKNDHRFFKAYFLDTYPGEY